MRFVSSERLMLLPVSVFSLVVMLGCGAQPATNTANRTNTNSNATNSTAANTNAPAANTAASGTVETKEPEAYQATVTLRLESTGGQASALPALTAVVARSGNDRRMEFTMPAGGRIVFLDKGGAHYLVMPEKRQYAELNQESLGFDVRRMLMPEQIVNQVKGVQGVERVSEEKYNGRDAIKYKYAALADTKTRAGEVATESFLIVDKETGLPLRTETVTESKSGSVQGVSGLRAITEITDLKTDAPASLFEAPTNLQKIESSQVRAQVDLIFNSIAAALTQLVKQVQPVQ